MVISFPEFLGVFTFPISQNPKIRACNNSLVVLDLDLHYATRYTFTVYCGLVCIVAPYRMVNRYSGLLVRKKLPFISFLHG